MTANRALQPKRKSGKIFDDFPMLFNIQMGEQQGLLIFRLMLYYFGLRWFSHWLFSDSLWFGGIVNGRLVWSALVGSFELVVWLLVWFASWVDVYNICVWKLRHFMDLSGTVKCYKVHKLKVYRVMCSIRKIENKKMNWKHHAHMRLMYPEVLIAYNNKHKSHKIQQEKK